MRKNIGIVYTAFWAAICACYGQATTNGTELADNLTSRSRVVVDAFENASNRVHALIQEVSPTPDLSGYATTGAVAAVSNAVAQKADLTRVVESVKTYLIPNAINGGDWASGAAGGISELDYNAISTAADTSGKIWWSGSRKDSFDPGGGMITVYTWATAYYSTDDDTMGAFLWRSAPSELPADVHTLTGYDKSFIFYNNYDNPNGWLDVFSRIDSGESVRVYDPDYGDTFETIFIGTNYAEKVTTHTESVVYSDSLDSATNAIAAMMDGKLSTTGGVVTGNIILPQTGGSGGKTTINGNGITAGMEGFTIDSFSDPLVLKGSSATINFSDTRFIRGWDAVSDGNGNSIARLFNSTNDFVRKSDFGQTITNVAEGVTGDATNALAFALGDSIESVRQTASNANNNVDYLEQFTIPAWRAADLLTATNFTKAYIATNNPAFVSAVTNCPVAIAASDAEALTQWGIYGGGGTIGALLAALAAAVAALKKKKMPLYPVGGTGNPVNATYESGVLTISPFSMAAYTPTANAAFSVEMGALPSDLETGKARDAVLVIDCSLLTEGQDPRVTWDTHFHPRTDTATDLAIVEAGKRAVFYISEYVTGEYAVGGWTETAGGNA